MPTPVTATVTVCAVDHVLPVKVNADGAALTNAVPPETSTVTVAVGCVSSFSMYVAVSFTASVPARSVTVRAVNQSSVPKVSADGTRVTSVVSPAGLPCVMLGVTVTSPVGRAFSTAVQVPLRPSSTSRAGVAVSGSAQAIVTPPGAFATATVNASETRSSSLAAVVPSSSVATSA